jgi:hypothetical protein
MKLRRLLALLMSVVMLLSMQVPSLALEEQLMPVDNLDGVIVENADIDLPEFNDLPDPGELNDLGDLVIGDVEPGADLDGADIDAPDAGEETSADGGIAMASYYAVTFDTQGGEPVPELQMVEEGGYAQRPEDPTRDRSAFTGWYLDGEDYFANPTPINSDVTLTAGWEVEQLEQVVGEKPDEEPRQQSGDEIEIVNQPEGEGTEGGESGTEDTEEAEGQETTEADEVSDGTEGEEIFEEMGAVTEESSYEFLSSLRRIEHPAETIDKFSDLMHEMKAYPDTPVLIEIKPSAKYHKVELLTAMTDELLRDGLSQENCIGIMGGSLEPGLRYVHKRIPYLPLGWCEGGKNIPAAPENRAEAEDRIYRVAQLTAGCAAGYNPEDVNINRLFNEYAKFRMLHVFVWSRSWTLSPSKWEENGPSNDNTYLSGFDAWTTDHGEYFLGYPIAINEDGDLVFRDGHTEKAECEELTVCGAKYYLYKIDLHFGDSYYICSEPKGE